MDLRLYEVCETGNFTAFQGLIEEDKFILREVMPLSGDTCLHVTARFGHATIAGEILNLRPDMAHAVNHEGLTPMHLAAANGCREVYELLLRTNPGKLCFLRDRDGRTPVHYVAMNGDYSMFSSAMVLCPQSTTSLTDKGETVLLLCAKYNKFEFLNVLISFPQDKESVIDLIHVPDNHGNTLIHLAKVAGQHALVTYMESRANTEDQTRPPNDRSVEDLQSQSQRNQNQPENRDKAEKDGHFQEQWLEGIKSSRGTTSVVAALIATASFAAGISPPGGVNSDGAAAGTATRAHTAAFKVFAVVNGLALLLSLTILILDIVVIPYRPGPLTKLAVMTRRILWAAVAMLLVAFMAAAWIVMPHVGAHGWVAWCLMSLGLLVFFLLVFCLIAMTRFLSDTTIPSCSSDTSEPSGFAVVAELNRRKEYSATQLA
ncbi:ankyrin repeat-containing protein ITN1 isoform X1 [Amborella trichopoda]|uniref:ankyrin repeat-containing protein ITN1 isoform X1 n=1 Tax=Amborella trichopoda TaxID=13333 RepID=UPI0009BFCE76|nr:ankyrin repeat-containing protein ITN1 isoform X1 [Amborella trichopoda]|eukprot:XP_020528646.1 ankyrin repeat-containing protein ITN1 isoform X1 [Amborella trichopoda]